MLFMRVYYVLRKMRRCFHKALSSASALSWCHAMSLFAVPPGSIHGEPTLAEPDYAPCSCRACHHYFAVWQRGLQKTAAYARRARETASMRVSRRTRGGEESAVKEKRCASAACCFASTRTPSLFCRRHDFAHCRYTCYAADERRC